MSNEARKKKKRLVELVKEKALKFGDFTLVSGKKSKYYLDGKQTTLTSEGAYLCASLFLDLLKEEEFDALGGVSLGADPIVGAIAALSWAEKRPINTFIIRKETKKHGTGKLIEGPLKKGSVVIIVEDVTTTGSSALKAAKVIQDYGCKVAKIITIIDREEGAGKNIAKMGFGFSSILKLGDIL
ncbi:MAG: orotate phosphoribosyltransferase [Actinomycetia bacterium]|nr:orotate phosphoribosyltransferase [Actinomycetes bacterium]